MSGMTNTAFYQLIAKPTIGGKNNKLFLHRIKRAQWKSQEGVMFTFFFVHVQYELIELG